MFVICNGILQSWPLAENRIITMHDVYLPYVNCGINAAVSVVIAAEAAVEVKVVVCYVIVITVAVTVTEV